MGCCASKQQDLYIDVPRTVSTTDTWVLRQKSFLGGCKLLPFTASCPASYPYQSLTRVVLGEGHLFAALWEGHGGSQAARHCVANCYEMLMECLKSNPDPCWALRQTTQQLDKSYFATELPDNVKAGVGATGIMVYINTQTNQCCVARMGNCLPFLAASKGSFNTTTVEVKPLSSSRNHRALFSELSGRDQQQQQQQQAGSAAGSSRAAAYTTPGNSASPGTYTNAVGLGYGKSQKLQQVWLKQESAAGYRQQLPHLPFITSDCEVSVCQLSHGDETLVLASEGLLQILPPTEVGMLLHHFNAAKLNELKEALTAAAAARDEVAASSKGGRTRSKSKGGRSSKEVQPDEAVAAAGKNARHPNVASIVMHHALMKALGKHNLALQQQQQQQGWPEKHSAPQLSYDHLTHLPLVVDKEAFRPPGAKGSNVQLHLPKHYPMEGLSRRDVHSDMGMVVVSLNWPRSQDSLPLPGMSPQRVGRRVSRPDAQYRWQLLRLAVKFHLAYRRQLRAHWWELVSAVEAAAEEAARQAEVRAWKTSGAAVKVNLAGDVLDPEAPLRPRHSPHKPPHQLSPSKKRTSLGSSLSSSSGIGRASARPAAGAAAPATPGSPMVLMGSPSSAVTGAKTAADVGSSGIGSRRGGPARLHISTAFDHEDLDEHGSDVESPSRLDSPSKAAVLKSVAVMAAAQPAKKAAHSPSPTKLYKPNLSLRANRTGGGDIGGGMGKPAAAGVDLQQGGRSSPSAGVAMEASWGTAAAASSRSSTPGQLKPSRAAAAAGPAAAKAAAAAAGYAGSSGSTSPVKGRIGTPIGREGSGAGYDHSGYDYSGYDYSGYHAFGYSAASGNAGRGSGSPTKLGSRKISLRKPASHY